MDDIGFDEVYSGAEEGHDPRKVIFTSPYGIGYLLAPLYCGVEDPEEVYDFLKENINAAGYCTDDELDEAMEDAEFGGELRVVATYQGSIILAITGDRMGFIIEAVNQMYETDPGDKAALFGTGSTDDAEYVVFVRVPDAEQSAFFYEEGAPALDGFVNDDVVRGGMRIGGSRHGGRSGGGRHGGGRPGGRHGGGRPGLGRHGGGRPGGRPGGGRPGGERHGGRRPGGGRHGSAQPGGPRSGGDTPVGPGRGQAGGDIGGGLGEGGQPGNPPSKDPARGPGSSHRRASTATAATNNTGFFGNQSDAGRAFGGMRR